MRHSRVGSSLLSLVLLLLTSCGGSDGPGTTEPDPPRLTVMNVLPDAVTLSFLGATSTLVAHLRDQNGQVIAGTVSWSSDNTAVVTVNGSGLLTAVQNGTATVTASTGSLSDVVPVTVQQVPTQLAVASGGDQSGAVGQVASGHWTCSSRLSSASDSGPGASVRMSGITSLA